MLLSVWLLSFKQVKAVKEKKVVTPEQKKKRLVIGGIVAGILVVIAVLILIIKSINEYSFISNGLSSEHSTACISVTVGFVSSTGVSVFVSVSLTSSSVLSTTGVSL